MPNSLNSYTGINYNADDWIIYLNLTNKQTCFIAAQEGSFLKVALNVSIYIPPPWKGHKSREYTECKSALSI